MEKPADSLRVRPGTGKGNTTVHIPFGTARQNGMFVRPAAAWAAQRKQSIRQKKLFIFFIGVDSSSDVTSLRNKRTTKLLSDGEHTAQSHQELCTNQTMLRKSQSSSTESSGAPDEAWVESGLLEFTLLWVPLLIMVTGCPSRGRS